MNKNQEEGRVFKDWSDSVKEAENELEQEILSLMAKWLDERILNPSSLLVRDPELIEPRGDE